MIQTGKKATGKCCQSLNLIENYDEAIESSKRWCIHHRLETHRWSKKENKWVLRESFVPQKVLEDLGLYWNRPASELIFMSWKDHQKLHHNDPIVASHKKKYGSSNGMYGRHRTLEETKNTRKPIICVETNITYNSITEAAKDMGFPVSSISICCKNGIPYKGFNFKYIGDEK